MRKELICTCTLLASRMLTLGFSVSEMATSWDMIPIILSIQYTAVITLTQNISNPLIEKRRALVTLSLRRITLNSGVNLISSSKSLIYLYSMYRNSCKTKYP